MASILPKPSPMQGNPASRESSGEHLRDHHLHHSPETRMPSAPSVNTGPVSRDHVTMSISSIADGRPSASRSPSKPDSLADAVHQLQSQVAQNTEALRNQRQDVERLEAAISHLQSDFRGINELISTMRREMHAKPAGAANSSDHTLELFATNLTAVTTKVTEIEGIKMQIEILKRRINRADDTSVTSVPPSSGYHSSPRDISSQPAHLISSTHVSEPQQIARTGTPSYPEIRPLPLPYHHQSQPADTNRAMEAEPQGSGWVSVNPAAKRSHPDGTTGRDPVMSHPVGSPKRPKLAPIEPRLHMDAPPQAMYDRMETEEGESRSQSRDSLREQGNSSSFIAYNSAVGAVGAHPEEAWKSSQYSEPRSPRRGGRGGGRGGRPRKSLPADMSELRNSEWDRNDGWATQMGPDGQYYPIAPNDPRRGGYVRRGSGGIAVPISRPPEIHRVSDPYAHTKKTRTKPTRNADGILIRKDGRPDMRSQSSAANLRKVHARKEQERAQELGHTSTGSPAGESVRSSSETPEEMTKEQAEESAQDRHQAIMRQMFPHGINESRDRMQFANKYFPSSSSPTEEKAERHELEKPGTDEQETTMSEVTMSEVEKPDDGKLGSAIVEEVEASRDTNGARSESREQEMDVIDVAPRQQRSESNESAPEPESH